MEISEEGFNSDNNQPNPKIIFRDALIKESA